MSNAPLVEAYFEATQSYLRTHRNLSESLNEGLLALAEIKGELKLLFEQLIDVSDSGDPEIWFAIGHGIRLGMGAKRDLSASEEWFRKAAEAGHSKSMVRLANQLARLDHESDRAESIAWLSKAAEAGDPSGMMFLGFAYREGQGVPCDPERATQWFLKAVESGDHHAAVHAGKVLNYHLGRPKEAIRWFLHAADHGCRASYLQLAMIHDGRESECFDPAEAVAWYQVNIAESGGSLPRSMLALARYYRDGIGVPRDTDIARVWLKRLITETPETNEFHKDGLSLLEAMDTEPF